MVWAINKLFFPFNLLHVVTVFYFVDVPLPQHCKSLAFVLHCLRFLEHCMLSRQKHAPTLQYAHAILIGTYIQID